MVVDLWPYNHSGSLHLQLLWDTRAQICIFLIQFHFARSVVRGSGAQGSYRGRHHRAAVRGNKPGAPVPPQQLRKISREFNSPSTLIKNDCFRRSGPVRFKDAHLRVYMQLRWLLRRCAETRTAPTRNP